MVIRPAIASLFMMGAYEIKDDVMSLWYMGDLNFAICVMGAFVLSLVCWFIAKESF